LNKGKVAVTIPDADQRYLAIRAEAIAAAGPLPSLRMRAQGYLRLYHASNGACRFALVAAHGALWASWYLVCAKLAACLLALIDPTCRLSPARRYRAFAAYVINASVMIETYVLVHTVTEFGPDFAAAKGIPADLARDYATAMRGPLPDNATLRDLYHRHFLWEQQRVVSTKLHDAFAVFDWPLMSGLCQRPWVWFSYFRAGQSLNFRSFTDEAERVEKGLIAYDRAAAFGVEKLARLTRVRLRIFPGTTAIALRLRQS
jgi:hypothetical protein